MKVEPSGERAQMELAAQAAGQRYSDTTGQGSYADYTTFRQQNPALYPRATQYGAIPGAALEGMAPGARANWLASKPKKDEIYARYGKAIDDLLRVRPWDSGAVSDMKFQRDEEIKALEEKYPLPPMGELPSYLTGMSPDEAWDSAVEQEVRAYKDQFKATMEAQVGHTLESTLDAFKIGYNEIDWDAYNEALADWKATLPTAFSFGAVNGGTYAGMVLAAAMDAIDQSYDTPLTAVLDVYRQVIVDPAWARYDQLKAQGAQDYYKRSVGSIPAIGAAQLIPAMLEMYPSLGWTEAQLRTDLAGVVFPALAEQKSGPAPKVPAPRPEPPSFTEWLQQQRRQPQFAPPGSVPTVAPAWKP